MNKYTYIIIGDSIYRISTVTLNKIVAKYEGAFANRNPDEHNKFLGEIIDKAIVFCENIDIYDFDY